MHHQRFLFLTLLVFTITSHVFSQMDASPKAVIIHRTYFQWEQGSPQENTLFFKARAQVNGLKSQQVKTTVLIGNSDGSPLNGNNGIPSGWTNAGKGVEYVWSGTIQYDQTGWDLKTPLPGSEFFSASGSSMKLIFRYTIECGGMKSSMESEIKFPFTSTNCTRSLQFDQVNGRQMIKVHQQPNVAGMGVDEPNFTVRDQTEKFTFQFSATGMKGENAYVGIVFRDPSGKPVTPSVTCPKSNYGQNGRVQFQAGEKILYDQASWKHFMLNVPVQWLDIDTRNDCHLIATCYISAGGLWSTNDREYTIEGMDPEQEESPLYPYPPEDFTASASSQTEALFESIMSGDMNGTIQALEQGADIRARNQLNQTPLHVAASLGEEAAAKLLVLADRYRAEQENSNSSNTAEACPTLFMKDAGGNTPVQLAQSQGHPALAKILMDSGTEPGTQSFADGTSTSPPADSSYSNSSGSNPMFRDDSSSATLHQDISRYTQPLEKILAQIIGIKEHLIRLKQAGSPPAQQVYTQGMSLFQVGKRFASLFTDGGEQALTRFGTLKEVDLLKRIRENHEKAALLFKELAGVTLPKAEAPATRRRRHRSLLEKVGKELIDGYAIRFIQRKGLGDLLADNGRDLIRQKVRKRLELDLKGFLDKKAIDLFGMPMGGFRSIKAAFRLQARHRIQALAGELILNFTGNRLAIFLLQKTVLNLLENKLWPLLREGFRPKTKLTRRVDISANSMMNMCDELNRLAGTGNPQLTPTQDISNALDRAEGTIAAARYLKKDLAKNGSQDLKDTLAAAEKILNRTVKRISHQFLLLDSYKWQEIKDQFNYIIGIHTELGKLLGLMNFKSCKVEIQKPKLKDMIQNKYYTVGTCKFPHFRVILTELGQDITQGIKTINLRINNREYTLYAIYRPEEKALQFNGCVPMFPGQNEVVFTSRDIPGMPETRKSYNFPPFNQEHTETSMKDNMKWLPGQDQAISEANDYHRPHRMLDLAQNLVDISDQACCLGRFDIMNQIHPKALELLEQCRLGPKIQRHYADIGYQKAWFALLNDNRSEYIAQKKAELQARQIYLQYLRDNNLFSSINLVPVYECCFETADMLLVLGYEPEVAKPYVQTGMQLLAMRRPGKGDKTFTNNDTQDYPNLAAIFLGR